MQPFGLNFDRQTATLSGAEHVVVRRVRDLLDVFGDAPENSLDRPVYEVFSARQVSAAEELHVGTCVIHPGHIGNFYHMTRGHRHVVPRGELYVGISGEGVLVMQNEETGECRVEQIAADVIVYVPPRWAHRHINTGTAQLVTLFSVAADAGHDYEFVQRSPFNFAVEVTSQGPRVVRVR